MVKTAFLDEELKQAYRLSSANSINITRLIPQTVYYFESYRHLQLLKKHDKMVVVVPSGNFGNLTAGLLSKRLGLPIQHFIAATNANDIVPQYLQSGKFIPRPSVATMSNAMDVGNPSNFGRMLELYENSFPEMQNHITGYAFTDEETSKTMKQVYDETNYVADPHGAVGLAAWREYKKTHPDATGVILETAHPLKFVDAVKAVLGFSPPMPQGLHELMQKKKSATLIENSYSELKAFLMERL
jgi:threonine synthase